MKGLRIGTERRWAGLLLLLALAAPARGQEWYIPKRSEVISGGSIEVGGRFQLSADENGVLNSREVGFVPSFRVSPVKRLEFYAEIPLKYREEESIVAFGYHSENDDGYGDVFTQTSLELLGREDWKLTLTTDVVIPTGQNPYEHRIGLGGGFYRITPGLSYMKIIDPAVLFLYVGNQWTIEEHFRNRGEVAPGADFRFRFGGTVLLNPRVRATVYTTGDVIAHTWQNGGKVAGSDGEIFRFGTGFDWDMTDSLSSQIYSTWGMTASTTDAVLSFGLTKKLR